MDNVISAEVQWIRLIRSGYSGTLKPLLCTKPQYAQNKVELSLMLAARLFLGFPVLSASRSMRLRPLHVSWDSLWWSPQVKPMRWAAAQWFRNVIQLWWSGPNILREDWNQFQTWRQFVVKAGYHQKVCLLVWWFANWGRTSRMAGKPAACDHSMIATFQPKVIVQPLNCVWISWSWR